MTVPAHPQLLPYGEHPSQFGLLNLPAGPGPWPVAVIVHGGFWRVDYGLELGAPLAADLLDHGFATWNLEYRRVGEEAGADGGGWPTSCLDVAAGVDLLASAGQTAADGQLDLSRVVAVGHSAGGQLAGWLATRRTAPPGTPGADPAVPLSGFVSQAGVLDLAAAVADDLGAGAARSFLGTEGVDWERASPIEQLPLGIPSVCVHGSADVEVPLSQSERFVAAARRAGDPAELVIVADADHFAPIDPGTAAWAACRSALLSLVG